MKFGPYATAACPVIVLFPFSAIGNIQTVYHLSLGAYIVLVLLT
jgi:hypothetical protein